MVQRADLSQAMLEWGLTPDGALHSHVHGVRTRNGAPAVLEAGSELEFDALEWFEGRSA